MVSLNYLQNVLGSPLKQRGKTMCLPLWRAEFSGDSPIEFQTLGISPAASPSVTNNGKANSRKQPSQAEGARSGSEEKRGEGVLRGCVPLEALSCLWKSSLLTSGLKMLHCGSNCQNKNSVNSMWLQWPPSSLLPLHPADSMFSHGREWKEGKGSQFVKLQNKPWGTSCAS